MTSDAAERAALLTQSLIFSGLNKNELKDLAVVTGEKSYGQGEFIFWEGDAPEWFYIVTAGRVKVLKQSSSGKDVIIAFFGPGEIFGEVAVFEDRPYPASAQAAAATRVLAIKKTDFIAFLAQQPHVALHIICVLSGRLRESQGRLRDMAAERVEQRLSRILLGLSDRLGSELPFTRQEIAEMAGTTVETAIRFMTRLREGGIIRSKRGKITIVNAAKLKLLADGRPGI